MILIRDVNLRKKLGKIGPPLHKFAKPRIFFFKNFEINSLYILLINYTYVGMCIHFFFFDKHP